MMLQCIMANSDDIRFRMSCNGVEFVLRSSLTAINVALEINTPEAMGLALGLVPVRDSMRKTYSLQDFLEEIGSSMAFHLPAAIEITIYVKVLDLMTQWRDALLYAKSESLVSDMV